MEWNPLCSSFNPTPYTPCEMTQVFNLLEISSLYESAIFDTSGGVFEFVVDLPGTAILLYFMSNQ